VVGWLAELVGLGFWMGPWLVGLVSLLGRGWMYLFDALQNALQVLLRL